MKKALSALMLIALFTLTSQAQQKNQFQVTWLGHAAFEIISPGGTHLVIDPWLKENPATPASFKDLSRYHPAAILVTHSHFDHSQDAAELAKLSGAKVVSAGEWLQKVGIPQEQQQGCNIGGTIPIGDITIHVVPAMHSSEPSGRPMGFVLTFADGRSLYHTGDTWIFGDMALIQELYHPVVILQNVGGGFWGSDPKTAALGIKKYFNPQVIVPMHFATFGPLAKEPEVRAAFANDKRLLLMTPGETKTF